MTEDTHTAITEKNRNLAPQNEVTETIVQPKKPSKSNRYWFIYLQVIVVFALFSWNGGPFENIERWLLDFQYVFAAKISQPPVSGKVVVLAVDDSSLFEVGTRWPWNRRLMASVIDSVSADGAKVIGMGLVPALRSYNDSAQDQVLARSIQNSGRLVLITPPEESGEAATNRPLSMFIKAAKSIGSDRVAAMGNLGRRQVTLRPLQLEKSPSFLGEVFRLFGEKDYLKAADEKGNVDINLRLLSQKNLEGMTIPVVDVIKGRCLKGTFKDKLVFIGVTASIIAERTYMPTLGDVPAIYLYAGAAETICSNAKLERLAGSSFLMTLLSFLLAFLIAFKRKRRAFGVAFCALISLSSFVFGTVALLFNIHLPLLPVLFGLWLFYQTAQSLDTLRQAEKQRETVRSLVQASRKAKIDPKLIEHINMSFGLELGPLPAGGGSSLPAGIRFIEELLAGQFEDAELIGKGGMGLVIKAKDLKRDEFVALKVLSPALIDDKEGRRRFKREAKAMERLDHENVIKVHDHIDEEFPYIVMEYLRGESLRTHLQRWEKLEPQEFCRIFRDVCNGVAYAHKEEVVHRDLKPDNIFITDDKGAKVVDFGLAHLKDITAMTRTGFVLGTPRYMAPEQRCGDLIDDRTDIYALGVMMLECIIGSERYTQRFGRYGATPNVEGLPKVWQPLKKILESCLQEEPEKRPASVQEVIKALGELESTSGQMQASADYATKVTTEKITA